VQQKAGELQQMELLWPATNGECQLTVSEGVPDGRTNRREGREDGRGVGSDVRGLGHGSTSG
jgi:hypothetical protein